MKNLLILYCSLKRCNIDGKEPRVSMKKCVYDNGSPCYYLLVKEEETEMKESPWSKFEKMTRGEE